ncbi:TadE/TadG family type IV pilus assembly protein [Anaeromyxobacter paludicola]|uniref:TadE-like domain-containing protein n=1 Tax=Anaeromyxobacter paludicola TaxID=2918171 RepID=A0ABM7X9H0_9BACT|nr:TadE/TadG family type IV pilus assembly protein [Anaeromyxobacter paludicola]BDG08494.1 hypothetical protein AMPC_16070 [Anaeromyxobacter paludicola]
MEFALVLPVLFLVLLGAIDWGYYFFVEEIVTNAAREGARAGSIAVKKDAASTASTVSKTYLSNSGLKSAPTVTAQLVTASGVDSVRVSIAYPIGKTGSITGFLKQPLIPAGAKALAEMRR